MRHVFPLTLCLLPLLVGCTSSNVSSADSSGEEPFVYPEVEPDEVAAITREGTAHIFWNDESHLGYRVYGSLSKYGDYHLLSGESLIRMNHFETTSNRYGYFKVYGVDGGIETLLGGPVSPFGRETLIVDELDDMASVQEEIDLIHDRLESGRSGQFSSERFAAMLLPGEYNELTMRLGYYSSCYGLGQTPDQTKLNELYVSTNVLGNNNSTCTFWRNAENLLLPHSTQFAVSQATSLRRMHFQENLYLAHPEGWSSGGFLADSKVDGRIESRTQQQWMTRNSDFSRWVGASHNYVFAGCEGGVPTPSWTESTTRTSVEEKVDAMAEMPFLTFSREGYRVFVPSLRRNTSGLSWGESEGVGTYIPLDDFYLAHPDFDDSETLNKALDQQKNIVFSPGIYDIQSPLKVTHENAILLGLGYATLQVSEDNRIGAIQTSDVGGLRIGGLLLDAGKKSDFLLRVGEEKTNLSHADNPSVISDLFCRIGGKENAHTEVTEAMTVNQNDLIGDNFWLWRADHSSGVGWNDYEEEWGTNYGNPSDTGVRVEGDRVSCYGLMVEHFEKYQTLWNGDYGKTVMYQSEVPYSVPSQEDWMSQDGQKDGYASYKVGDQVAHHYALGLGVYWVHYTHDFLDCAFEAPQREGVKLDHLVTTTFSGYASGGIRHVINDYGDAVGEGGKFRALVATYPTGA